MDSLERLAGKERAESIRAEAEARSRRIQDGVPGDGHHVEPDGTTFTYDGSDCVVRAPEHGITSDDEVHPNRSPRYSSPVRNR